MSATWRASSLSFVRWTISSPTRFRRWSSFAKSTRTMLERVGARAAASGALPALAGSGVAAAGAGPRRGRVEQSPQGRLLGREVPGFVARGTRRFDGRAQRARPLEQAVEGVRVEDELSVAGAGEDLLEPVDVVLDPGEAEHPAVALEGVQRPEEGGRDLGVVAVALEAEEGGVEDREVLPRVLEVDADQLGGDLELHQRELGGTKGLTAP